MVAHYSYLYTVHSPRQRLNVNWLHFGEAFLKLAYSNYENKDKKIVPHYHRALSYRQRWELKHRLSYSFSVT